MKANEIVSLLSNRHSEDVFIPECKNGPTQSGEHVRLDAWAMSRSWSRPLVTGYEIKVSRSDFLNDKKWHAYLPLCNCLYFVTLPNIINPEEVPEQCGHIVTAGSRLLTKKKAPYREVTIPESLWRYIIMCRARIGGELPEEKKARKRQEWKEWLAQKDEDRERGHYISMEIKRMLHDARRRIEDASETEEKYRPAKEALAKLGISSWDIVPGKIEEALSAQFERLNAQLPDEFISKLDDAGKSISRLLDSVKPKQTHFLNRRPII